MRRADLDPEHEPIALRINGWHAAFWIMLGLALLFIAIHPQMTGTARVEGAITIAVLGIAYAALMQRKTRQEGWRALIYLIIAICALGTASSIDANLSMLLFIVYSQVWVFTPGLAVGTGFAVAATVSTMLGFLVNGGFTWQTVRDNGPQMAVALLFSVLLGVWISRVIEQSIDRAGLIEQLESARTELNEAEHARGVMAERERMAREIHDTIAQGFTSIVMLAQAASAGMGRDPARAARQLADIEEVARENLAEARALVAAFSPVGLENSTLPDAVRRLTQRFAAETGVDLSLEIAEAASRLSRDQEVVLLRAVQESLTNVRRHAGARHVQVRLLVSDAGARVEVGDDGVGFAVDEAGGGFGLAGMRGRVADVGGEMDISSSPGAGTRVTVLVPVRGTPAAPAGQLEEA